MFGTINGNHFNMIQRNIFDIEEWIDILFEIDRLFISFSTLSLIVLCQKII